MQIVTMRNSGIYRIELGNGWFYIGSAINLSRREGRHHRDLKQGKHCNNRIQRCWNKHNTFEFIVLEECDIEELIVREQFYLNKYFNHKKNVNLNPTAGSSLGIIRSAATCVKMSAAQIGKVHSAETRERMSASRKGKKRSAETRANMVAAWEIRRQRKKETSAQAS